MRLTLSAALLAALLVAPVWAQTSTSPSTPDSAASQPSTTNPPATSTSPGSSSDMSATGMTGQPPGSTSGAKEISGKDRSFLKDVMEENQQEIQLGQIAQQKATDPQVKQFAQKLVTERQQIQTQLRQIAQRGGMDISKMQEKEGEKSSKFDRLQKLSGAEFDKEFAKEAVKMHRKDVRRFEEYAKEAKHDELKNLATQKLTNLRQHLDTAQTLSGEGARQAGTEGTRGFTPTGEYDKSMTPGTQPGTSPSPSGTQPGTGTMSPGSSSTPDQSSPGSSTNTQ